MTAALRRYCNGRFPMAADGGTMPIGREGDAIVFEAESGRYEFEMRPDRAE